MIITHFTYGKTKVLKGSYGPTANKWLFKKQPWIQAYAGGCRDCVLNHSSTSSLKYHMKIHTSIV